MLSVSPKVSIPDSRPMPRYSSAGPVNAKRTSSVTQNAKPVPGGFRGYEPSNETSKTPPPSKSFQEAGRSTKIQTFEQYQMDKKKQLTGDKKPPPQKKTFNIEELPVNQFPCLVVVSVTIETMNRLLGRTPKTDILFEFYGILDSPVTYLAAIKAKKFTLRQG